MLMPENPELRLALSYAPLAARDSLAALWRLDVRLGLLLRQSSDPMVAQLRLTWWHEALTLIDDGTVPAEPVLRALAQSVVAAGVTGARLATMIDGWEVLLDDGALDRAALDRFADARGGTLFDAAALVLGVAGDDRIHTAGEGWALADLARHARDPVVMRDARAAACARLDGIFSTAWPRRLRCLGALAVLARRDCGPRQIEPVGAPVRVGRMLWHRLTGR